MESLATATVETIETNLELNPKLREDQKATLSPTLQTFLTQWDNEYRESVSSLPLFNTTPELDWSSEQKQFFCKIFYHARGHLSDFLWYMGNVAPNMKSKELVLYNYSEEFGGHSPSHEQLYFFFTKEMGVPSPNDVTDPKYYLPFLKEFNDEHVNWLKTHDWDGCLGAYSAYERLDNLDYANLLVLAENLGATKKGLIFFKVHSEVEHFDATTELLNESWNRNEEIVRQSFEFIAKHQQKMWEKLSHEAFNYKV